MKFATFSDMPLASAIAATNVILNKIADGGFKQHMLLVGECGSGKSELARHLPYWFYKSHHFEERYLKWYDCPNEWDMRGLVNYTDTVCLNPSGYEWIVLDEVDKVHPSHRINQLHGPLGKPSDKLFILTANSLSILPPGIQSRCMTVQVIAPTPQEYLPYAQKYLAGHGKSYSDAKVLADLTNAVTNGLDVRNYEKVLKLLV